jgi:CRISPR system Cascade subunit CasE
MSSDAPLFMLRAEFDQPALMRFASRAGLALRIADGGYLLHAALRALFGDAAPKPFVVRDRRARGLTLLGYAACDHRELADRARGLADPLAVAAIDFDSICSKLMPAEWRAGAVYRFEARVCPVIRLSGRRDASPPRETDAFIHRCLRAGPDVPVDREEVYREWLVAETGRSGAARLREARLVRFHRQRLARRDRSGVDARLRSCERPDATLAGTLEVAQPGAFAALIRRGLGRHRAFGFGMLLLSH